MLLSKKEVGIRLTPQQGGVSYFSEKVRSIPKMNTSQKSAVWTDDGMLRIRWWPFAAAGALGGMYALYNILIFALVISGFARGFKADPVLHAPLIWIFGG